MSIALLDWGVANGVRDAIDTKKAEFVLLAAVVNPVHAILNGLTIEHPVIHAQAALLLPARFSTTWVYADNPEHIEAEWTDKALRGVPRDITIIDNPTLMSHEVFWATKFSRSPISNQAATDKLNSLIAIEMAKDNPDADVMALMLIALVGLGQPAPQGAEAYLFTGLPPDLDSYHPYLTADYYRALRSL